MSGSETPDAVRFPVMEPKGAVTHPLTTEERYHSLATLYKHQYFATYRHIARQTSWEVANRIADDMAAESIPMLAEGFKRAYGLTGTGAALVAQVHVTEMLVEGSDVRTLTETADEAEYEVVCPWGAAIASGRFEGAEEIADGLCNRGCWGFMQRVAETVSDDLDVDRRTWMGDGASSCHFCISRK